MKRFFLALALCFFALKGSAQGPLPVYRDAFGKVDKIATTGYSLLYTASFADAMTTREALADGAVERNPFLRPLYARAPGAAEALKFSINGLQVYGMKKMLDHCGPNVGCRTVAKTLPYLSAAFFAGLAMHNHHIATECHQGLCK